MAGLLLSGDDTWQARGEKRYAVVAQCFRTATNFNRLSFCFARMGQIVEGELTR